MHKDPLDDFDTSYWQPKDSVWMAERESQWREVEVLLYLLNKSKKAKGIIKRYFFKGELPSWEKLRDWDSSERHLDLMLFLYLHPSQDAAVLAPLREAYFHSRYIVPEDILVGMRQLLRIGLISGYSICRQDLVKDLPHLEGTPLFCNGDRVSLLAHTGFNNERLFRLIFTDPDQRTIERPGFYERELPLHSVLGVWEWSEWLTYELSQMPREAADMLYQYDYPLDFWYAQCGRDMQRFVRNVRLEAHVSMLLMAFYRFQHFLNEHDESDPRAPFVRKLVQLIDSREFIAPFKRLWEEVKSGEVVVDKIWTCDSKLKRSALWSAFKAQPKWDLS
jgi:hypothetical protein